MRHLYYIAFTTGLTSCGWSLYAPPNGTTTFAGDGNRVVLSVSASAVRVGESATFKATGGRAPYVYSVISGTGTVSAAGIFVGSASGVAVVRATDEDRRIAEAAIVVEPAR